MQINWYPGHMKKTKESIQKNLSSVDIVIELRDARIPISSKNPIIEEILGDKPRIIALNKSDLASDRGNRLWKEYFEKKGQNVVFLDSTKGQGISELNRLSQELTKEKMASLRERGVINRTTRAMIIGIPNVGKSTLINTLTGRKGARIGNRPGVTRTNQWIKTRTGLELLDTPGILWPKFEDPGVGLNLAFTGAIKDEIMDRETLALRLIENLTKNEPEVLVNRYDLEELSEEGLTNMEAIGRRRGCIISGGEIDYSRVSDIVLDEFRNGVLGRITLELPEELEE